MVTSKARAEVVSIPIGSIELNGTLTLPDDPFGIVVFAHGSGSSRHSPRNKYVADVIQNAGLGTLLFDLLTLDEEAEDQYTREFRFDIALLARRLVETAQWLRSHPETNDLKIGLFGSSTGGGAALVAAAELGDIVGAVVSRGGRPDLAGDALPHVKAPVLLLVGGLDDVVMEINERAYARLNCEKRLTVIPGATHLFEERGKLEEVAALAADWFKRYLNASNDKSLRQHAVG